MTDNFNNLLGGRATPSASFKGQFPIEWGGKLLEATKKIAFEYDPSKPNNRGAQKFWQDGNPVENIWLTLQTDVRDPNIQDDDGRRVLVLDSKNKLEAVQNAVRESGADFAAGGELYMQWYGNDPNGKNPDNPPKLYRARWTGPTLNSVLAGPTGQPAQDGWGQQAAAPAPASPAPATGGWGSPPAQAPAAPAQGGWGAPAVSAPAPSSPGAGWGTPTPAPAPDPTPAELPEALRKKGVDLSGITSLEQAQQIWSYVKNNPDVA